MYEYQALVTGVHDGDTASIRLDLGFDLWLVTNVRLLGINAPELTMTRSGRKLVTKAGEASTLALLGLLGRHRFAEKRTRPVFGTPGDYLALPGSEPAVVVQTRLAKSADLEKYGRVLADVRLSLEAPQGLNELMLAGGHARPATYA